jgi:nitrite reductase/ring-hydroxylating ferredoxin subunit/alkylhydroperoxidase/carboxymuconolactone decarboxylase family protein YurZ
MSDALDYLTRMRPEAMGHYFRFLKETGKSLDPKTRALISVITKAHAQTERGLRQYVKRARAEGASPAEILDALLMAFPALGLTKIVWAVDVLLASGMAEFAPDAPGLDAEAPPAKPETPEEPAAWHRVAGLDQLAAGAVKRLECDGRELFVVRNGTEFGVYDSRCPHQNTNIPLEALEGRTLRCPKHGWAFDIASGACIEKGDRPLRRYKCKTGGRALLAYW